MQYDLLLRGGRVIDPAQNIDGAFDVAILDGKIAAVTPNIVASAAKKVVDVSGKLVLGLGVVYERTVSECDEECTQIYPDFTISLSL